MRNYEAVEQWAARINADKAYAEITNLKAKYPWLRCDESYNLIVELYADLPKLIEIIKQQEKQNAVHREFVRVSRIADEAIVYAVSAKIGVTI